ncbi:Hsp70 family protein [Alkaliphilus oremlandii]|uniref:Heat shock protein 70 n=1 Tax=Alkaliphilus oremlandii (strain OhILAs) TaxID=350688 RepID=A8MID9_ALKOO|nr:Hsp70 family protein [Alkaliphilus oremlandii]ABW19571.1 Heat shock protein 70 [Alkaliphilus oremlandii OhILAs]
MSGIKQYFGIDFGTTNTAMTGILKSDEGKKNIRYGDEYGSPFPSLVAIDKLTGKVYCGRDVWKEKNELSETCEIIKSIKSYLGTEKIWTIAGKIWTPEIVAGHLFMALKENARNKYQSEVKEAVVSVPVGFSSKKRQALRKAAKEAGINIKSFISESTAALLENYKHLKQFSKIAVFDWGGGTLDVSVVEIKNNTIKELSVSGMKLGGDDIDEALARWAHSKAANKKKSNISFDEMPLKYQDKILTEAEKAKKELSYEDSTNISILKYGELGSVHIHVDFDQFTALTEKYVLRAIGTLEEAVSTAQLNMEEIDCILMVGGSSNLRVLHEKIEQLWINQHIEFPEDPEWSAAEGATSLGIYPGCFKLNQDVGLILSDNTFFSVQECHTTVPSKENQLEFGIVEDTMDARFIFSDNTYSDKEKSKKILDYVTVPVYGFGNERIVLRSYIDEDLVFKAKIKSNHKMEQFERTYELSDLKFYYELPKGLEE